MLRAASVPRTLWIVVLLAAALRIVPVWFGLPFPHARPDEAVAIGHAMDVLAGDFNPRFFHWPSLTFYLFAAVLGAASLMRRLLTGDAALPPDALLIIARTTVAIAGTLTAVVLFRIGRRISDARTGVIAAAFLAVAILHVRDSHFAMTDVLMTLLVTSSLAVLLRGMDAARGAGTFAGVRLSTFAQAGLIGGLAASTKYNAAAIVAAMAAVQLLLWRDLHGRPWAPRTWLPSLTFAGAFVAGFLVATPYAVLDYRTFSADLIFDFTHLSGGHGINLGRGWLYHLKKSLPYGVGPLIFAAGVAGIPVMAWRHPRPAFVVGSFALAFYAAIGSGYTVFFRYVLPLLPVICLTAAVAIVSAAHWAARRTRIAEPMAVGALALIAAGPALVNCIWFDVLLARTDTRVLAGEWLASRIQAGESVHDAGGDYARLELGPTRFHYWHFDPATNSFGHPEGLTPTWLVLTQSPLRTYAYADPALRRLASERYDLAFAARGTKGAAGAAVYDLQDAFFMPVSDFHTVERPGPTVLVYRRRD